MFEVKKPFLLLEIPYFGQNKIASTRFIKKFHQFALEKYDIAVKWLTKKVKSLFPLKDRNLHPSCKIYKGICSCGETYIGETIRNVEERWSEHNSADNKSEPAKHLADNKEHSFLRSILLAAPKDNRQEDSNMLTLFRNGVTQLPLFVRWTETYSKLTRKILRECLNDFVLVSLLQTLSKNLSIGTASYY